MLINRIRRLPIKLASDGCCRLAHALLANGIGLTRGTGATFSAGLSGGMSDAPDEQRIDDFLASVANYESFGLYELNEALMCGSSRADAMKLVQVFKATKVDACGL